MPSSAGKKSALRSEEHTSELQSREHLVCRLLLAKKKDAQVHLDVVTSAATLCGSVGSIYRRHGSESGASTNNYPCYCALSRSYFFFNDTATTEIYTLSLHDALPIWQRWHALPTRATTAGASACRRADRKSTRLNSSHGSISYAVFCLKKTKHEACNTRRRTRFPAHRATSKQQLL